MVFRAIKISTFVFGTAPVQVRLTSVKLVTMVGGEVNFRGGIEVT